MMPPHIGEIRIFAGSFAPAGWMFCHGQLIPISENDTLFTLIGTTYGGDGQETFALPDLRGRVPIHMGTGPDGTTYQLGEAAGTESETLTTQQIPVHNHAATGKVTIPVRGDSPGHLSNPANAAIAVSPGKKFFSKTESASGTMAPLDMPGAITHPAGGSQPHDNMQPFLAVNYIISMYGIFPSQS
ncbi:phage tail protein [Flavihumibacter sp. R14]|nr:phage tail protein [Flavihumibacter soli]